MRIQTLIFFALFVGLLTKYSFHRKLQGLDSSILNGGPLPNLPNSTSDSGIVNSILNGGSLPTSLIGNTSSIFNSILNGPMNVSVPSSSPFSEANILGSNNPAEGVYQNVHITFQRGSVNILSQLEQSAKTQLKAALSEIWHKDIVTLIKPIEGMFMGIVHEVEKDALLVLENLKAQILVLLRNVKAQVISLLKYGETEFKNIIINSTKKDILTLKSNTLNDVSQIMNRLEQIKNAVECDLSTIATKLENEVLSLVKIFDINPLDPCRIQLNTIFPGENFLTKPFIQFSSDALYYYTKCTALNPLQPTSSMSDVLKGYQKWASLANKMRCLSFAEKATYNEKFYLKEYSDAQSNVAVIQSVYNLK